MKLLMDQECGGTTKKERHFKKSAKSRDRTPFKEGQHITDTAKIFPVTPSKFSADTSVSSLEMIKREMMKCEEESRDQET